MDIEGGRPKILVTGHAGKLGGLVFADMQNRYGETHEIVGFDVRRNREQDITSIDALRRAMQGVEFVVHCAGIPHPNKGPFARYWQINVEGTHNVVRAAIDSGVRRMVYTSSTGWYGCDLRGGFLNPMYFPIDEGHPAAHIEGRAPDGLFDEYNRSKVIVEAILAYYGRRGDIEIAVLRIAPANTKEQQYPGGMEDWRDCKDWRRGAFFANCHPDNVVQAVRLCYEYEGLFRYDVFNVCDKYTHWDIDVPEFLAEQYPGTPARGIEAHSSLFSTAKAEHVLGYVPVAEMR